MASSPPAADPSAEKSVAALLTEVANALTLNIPTSLSSSSSNSSSSTELPTPPSHLPEVVHIRSLEEVTQVLQSFADVPLVRVRVLSVDKLSNAVHYLDPLLDMEESLGWDIPEKAKLEKLHVLCLRLRGVWVKLDDVSVKKIPDGSDLQYISNALSQINEAAEQTVDELLGQIITKGSAYVQMALAASGLKQQDSQEQDPQEHKEEDPNSSLNPQEHKEENLDSSLKQDPQEEEVQEEKEQQLVEGEQQLVLEELQTLIDTLLSTRVDLV